MERIGPEMLSLAQMTECAENLMKARGLRWTSGTPEIVRNNGRDSRLIIMDDDHLWLTEASQATGEPATISAEEYVVQIFTMDELRADLTYYFDPVPENVPKIGEREAELRAMLADAIPKAALASVIVTAVEVERTQHLKDGRQLLSCTYRGRSAHSILAQEIAAIVQDRLDTYVERHSRAALDGASQRGGHELGGAQRVHGDADRGRYV
jgi:hypothetical protein